ncbi:hypothetical protein FUT82_14780 [Treponema phagedenis]|uniref:Uncharacterized protein n=1 Tax=Treponema phagedenis TaxID=162 RepID=A0AAE6IXB5_TREPH|nr:hypothetical protein FUT82_14780 [Treponema phagedenis]
MPFCKYKSFGRSPPHDVFSFCQRRAEGRRATGSGYRLRLFLRYFRRAKRIRLRAFEKALRRPPPA